MKKCTAILGPFDQPNSKVEVEVIRAHDMPGFFVCQATGGQRLVVHWQKLTPLG